VNIYLGLIIQFCTGPSVPHHTIQALTKRNAIIYPFIYTLQNVNDWTTGSRMPLVKPTTVFTTAHVP